MAQFNICIAGHTAQVCSLFESTRDYCSRYLSREEPEFTVEVFRQELAAEQAALRREAEEEGIRYRTFTDPFLERAVIQRKVAEQLFRHEILLIHGSTVAVDGKAYLFTAKCGTGKSTHTRLWRQVFGNRAVMVNDDKPFLELGEDGVTAHGSPWSGKHGLDSNVSVPLQGICILERGTENRISRITPEQAASMLRHQGYCPEGMEQMYLTLVDKLMEQTPLWRMECTKDPQAAMVSYEAMSKDDFNT